MNTVGDTGTSCITVQQLREQYGVEVSRQDCGPVTFTSLATSLEQVTPGSLYIPTDDERRSSLALTQAQYRGAYAVLVPRDTQLAEDMVSSMGVPVLYASLSAQELGTIAATLAHFPARSIAVFAIVGNNTGEYAGQLAYILHILGNPVGVICSSMSKSLDSDMPAALPLSSVDVQRMLDVIVEDGAAACVFGVDQETLQRGALATVAVDVCTIVNRDGESYGGVNEAASYYGAVIGEKMSFASRSEDSDELAHLFKAQANEHELDVLSTCIACVLAAGVRKSNIRSALKVAREMD